ncbi:MAG: SIS domain-containing protein [Actinomycetota bacterium]|nr:SIS domain-containing protein [Actinomycetota bacterium]
MDLDKYKIIEFAKKAIHCELNHITKVSDSIGDDFFQATRMILDCGGKVILFGLGKSGHVGKKIAASMASTGTPSFFLHADEALHGDLGMIEKKDVVIALSNSGETRELLNAIPTMKKIGCRIISITSNENSTLAQHSDLHISIGKIKEADHLNLAPTTSSTVTLVLGDALAVTLSYLKGFKKKDFALCHPGGSLGKSLTGKSI